jgi:hypothetical protein
MNKPHRHAECIKAWADGAQIQVYLNSAGGWTDDTEPDWYPDYRYRIKPQPVITKAYMHYDHIEELVKQGGFNGRQHLSLFYNNRNMAKHLELTFTDNKLTKVELKDATK